MAQKSQQLSNNPLIAIMSGNRATIDSNIESNNTFIESTVYSNRNYMSSEETHIQSTPNTSNTEDMVQNKFRPNIVCKCNEEWIEFCKMHAISHSDCLATKHVRCMLCSVGTDLKSIQQHMASDRHKQRHKQLMEFLFLLSLPVCSPSQAMKISQLLEAVYKRNALNRIDFEKRLRVVQIINDLIGRHEDLNGYSIRIYGSTITGFGLTDSDINLDIICNHSESGDKTDKYVNSVSIILSKISDIIESNVELFHSVRNEYNLKVPKVRFKDRINRFEIELSITVQKSYQCSKLLQQYCQIDQRVSILGIAFREWARIYRFDDQENGLWPAFTFPILAIHFLQRCSPPVLPCLHELLSTPSKTNNTNEVQNQSQSHSTKASFEDRDKDNDTVEEDFNISSLNWKTTNDKSVGQLWLEMLRYYTAEFDSETYVVSIRSTRSPQMRTDKHWTSHMLAVEDPTRPSLNLSRSVATMRLYNEFVLQLRNTFKYFAVPFINVMPNNHNSNVSARPLFTERDFSILVNQYQYYDSLNVSDLLTQITNVCNELDNESEAKNKGSDDSDCEDESKRNEENFHLKAYKILKTFGIRMQLSAELENTMALIPANQLYYSFAMNKMPFFATPPKFCRLCHRYGHQQYRCPDNELPKLEPLPDFKPKDYDLLENICCQIFREKRMDQNEERIQTYILSDLEYFIRQEIPNARLELFGSTKNGFGARNCDLDICLTFEDNQTGEGLEFERIIENVGKILERHDALKNITPIVSAKVPIVKFGYILDRLRCVECDISLYNILARHNTRLLRSYCLIDPRVQVLGFVVKHFAKTCDMCDASRGSLSSYAYSLMTIHYLQQKRIIPVLQEIGLDHKKERVVDGWDTWFFEDLPSLSKYWRPVLNRESVAELFVGFLRYFSEAFNFEENVISCRLLSPLKRLEKMWTGSKIAIEDPFLLSHNLGAGVSPQMAIFIKTSLILGRNHFGFPPPTAPDARIRNWSTDYFFRRQYLTNGIPPTGRGCRTCGKIGHKQNNCPESRDRYQRQERHDRPEKIRDKKQNNRRKHI